MTPDRRAVRRLTGVTVAPVLTALLMTGCTGEDPAAKRDDPDPAGSPFLTQDEVYARIPLEGSEDEPLYWELELPAEAPAAQAVTAAQHYEALVELLLVQKEDQRTDRDLLGYLATEEEAERIDRILRAPENPQGTPSVGPRWMALLDAEAAGTEAVVAMCFDIGWWTRDTASEQPPRSDARRASVTVYRLVLERDNDADPRWKVDRVAFNNIEVSDPALQLTEDEIEQHRRQCEQWAVHTPADQ